MDNGGWKVSEVAAFWHIPLHSLVVDRRFRGAYCLYHQGDELWWRHLWNVGHCLRDYAAQQPRSFSCRYSPPRALLMILNLLLPRYFLFSSVFSYIGVFSPCSFLRARESTNWRTNLDVNCHLPAHSSNCKRYTVSLIHVKYRFIKTIKWTDISCKRRWKWCSCGSFVPVYHWTQYIGQRLTDVCVLLY